VGVGDNPFPALKLAHATQAYDRAMKASIYRRRR
jgi:hypothetical protein